MLVEGIDDEVLIFSLIVILIFTLIMISLISRSSIFRVQQLNPQLHTDSVNDVDGFRHLLPSAPPQPTTTNTTTEQTTSPNLRSRHTQNSQISCPICLCTSNLPIETNCGHLFCANCIIQYWSHLTSNIYHSKMKCPMCRQLVTCLLPLYNQVEERQRTNEFDELFTQINNYNRRFSGAPRNFMDYITDIPILLRHVVNEMFTLNSLPLWYRIRFAFVFIISLLYFLSPLDLIPEALFGIVGFIDDLLVVLILSIYACQIYRQVIANRQ